MINATPQKRCDAALYLIPEVITNPKRDIINPKHDITKNTPNTKANILIPSSVTKSHHTAYSSCAHYNNFTNILVFCVPPCEEHIDDNNNFQPELY